MLSKMEENLCLSSALSICSGSVPSTLTPLFLSLRAMFWGS